MTRRFAVEEAFVRRASHVLGHRVGQRRTQATLKKGLTALGPEVVQGLRFVCSDMWKPYLGVIAEHASQALHVLDRFHITMHAKDVEAEVAELKARGVTFEEYTMPGLTMKNSIVTAGGAKTAWFKDTEGNILAITQRL